MSALLSPPLVPFVATVSPLTDAEFAAMAGRSWHDDPRCPRRDRLRLLRVCHVTPNGTVGQGQLVVAAAIANASVALFARLYGIGFPIAQMQPIDVFAGNDDASMAANNSSAFNFRTIAGRTTLSLHAFGHAIDINPLWNPWIGPSGVAPPNALAFCDRRWIRPGMFVRPGPAVAVLDELGWEWGGDWQGRSDYHHVVAPAHLWR